MPGHSWYRRACRSGTDPKMASPAEPGAKSPATDSSSTASAMEEAGADDQELRRLRIAHEGMRLLLNSEVKQAELLFRSSR